MNENENNFKLHIGGGGGVRSYWANKKNRNGVLISLMCFIYYLEFQSNDHRTKLSCTDINLFCKNQPVIHEDISSKQK